MKEERQSSKDVLAQVKAERPNLAEHLHYDRAWLWYCGPKSSDDDREYLKSLKFRYKCKDHALPDGKTGRWYFWDKIPPHKPKHGTGSARSASPRQPAPITMPSQRVDFLQTKPQQPKPLTTDDIEAMIRAELGISHE